MYEYSVTIGRNVGSEPMAPRYWRQFQADCKLHLELVALLDDRFIDALETTTGHDGEYDGIPEDNARIVMRTAEPLSDDGLGRLRRRLAQCATKYMQECVALTIGTSELITAR